MRKFFKFKFIFIFSFFLMFVIANFHLNKFSNQFFVNDGYTYSSLYQEDAISYFKVSDKISKDIENGGKFYNSGTEYTFSFLYPRIIYFFNSLFNNKANIIDNQSFEIKLKNDKFFLYFQIIFFYTSVIYLFTSLVKITNKNLSAFICIFLLFNPIIFQWHLSFYTESIFLSFLVILTSFLIRSKSNIDFLFIGIFIGMMYMQRTIALLYPLVIFFFVMFNDESLNKKILKFTSFMMGVILILILIGSHNYSRSGIFYFTPIQSKLDLQRYLEIDVIKDANNITYSEARGQISDFNSSVIENYKYDLTKENDKIKYSNKIQKNSFKTILKNKVITLKIVSNNYLHSIILNPVQVFYESKYQTWIEYKESTDHEFWLTIRLIITPIFFILSMIGLVYSFKKIHLKLNIFLFLSIFYFFIISCWLPNTRYFVSSVLFVSIYFSIFLYEITLYFKKKLI